MKIHIKNNLYFSYQTPPIIIAEISGNHNGKLSVLKRAILNAKKNGADLVKIQNLRSKKAFGKIKLFGTYTKRPKHHLDGMRNYSNSLKKIR